MLHFSPLPRARGLRETEPATYELDARLAEGEEFYQVGRHADAETLFRHVLDWRSDDLRAANDLACSLWQQQRIGEAETVLAEVMRRDPGNADAEWNLKEMRRERNEAMQKSPETVPNA